MGNKIFLGGVALAVCLQDFFALPVILTAALLIIGFLLILLDK